MPAALLGVVAALSVALAAPALSVALAAPAPHSDVHVPVASMAAPQTAERPALPPIGGTAGRSLVVRHASVARHAFVATQSSTAAARAAAYLTRAQQPNGAWGESPRSRTTYMHTSWVAIGLAAAGRDPRRVTRAGRSAADVLWSGAAALRSTADLERTILALAACGLAPRRTPAGDLVARLRARQDNDGSFDRLVNLTAFGVLALRAAGTSHRDGALQRAARALERRQNTDGGYNFAGRGGPSGIDDTAAAVQALASVRGGGARVVRRAAAFLTRQQNPDGGFALQLRGRSNAQSTAFAIQGLIAAGRDPERQRRAGSRSPLGYLRSLQAADGSIRYSRTSAQTPVWVTAQALAALSRRAFPLSGPAARRALAATIG